jgi:predicted metal-dependent hydrolase
MDEVAKKRRIENIAIGEHFTATLAENILRSRSPEW